MAKIADIPHPITILLTIAALALTIVGWRVTTATKSSAEGPPKSHIDEPQKPPDKSAGPVQTPTAAVPRQCSGNKPIVFSPKDPGVLPKGPDGNYIDLGDGGGGTRFYKWEVSWTAPAKIVSVDCTAGRNEPVIGKGSVGSTASCVGKINGGQDPITLTVAWDGPCDQQ